MDGSGAGTAEITGEQDDRFSYKECVLVTLMDNDHQTRHRSVLLCWRVWRKISSDFTKAYGNIADTFNMLLQWSQWKWRLTMTAKHFQLTLFTPSQLDRLSFEEGMGMDPAHRHPQQLKSRQH